MKNNYVRRIGGDDITKETFCIWTMGFLTFPFSFQRIHQSVCDWHPTARVRKTWLNVGLREDSTFASFRSYQIQHHVSFWINTCAYFEIRVQRTFRRELISDKFRGRCFVVIGFKNLRYFSGRTILLSPITVKKFALQRISSATLSQKHVFFRSYAHNSVTPDS